MAIRSGWSRSAAASSSSTTPSRDIASSVDDDGGPDVFLHGSVFSRAGLGVPERGQRVSVMVAQGARGPHATDIALL